MVKDHPGGGGEDGGEWKCQHLRTHTCVSTSFIPQVLEHDWI